jgi:ABC-type glutathione transport system ATPase component
MNAIAVESLSIENPRSGKSIVEGLSFSIPQGACLGLVGESGTGKTLTALALCGLLPEPLRLVCGGISINGKELEWDNRLFWQGVRGKGVFMIFQSASLALDPTMRIGAQIAEALHAAKGLKRKAARARTAGLLEKVGLGPETERCLPFQLSGGMRQRVQIAIAMALEPSVLIADEPTTGLDPSIQVQILGLLDNLRRTLGTSLLIISHDLKVIAQMADSVCVIHKGRPVESGSVEEVFRAPRSPYTKRLIRYVLRQEGIG